MDDAIAALRRSPLETALFLDFDGTLAPIVPQADQARPLPGVAELLQRLHAAMGRVAVVSGRPVAFLQRHVPAEIELHGLYGLESAVGGPVAEHPAAARWRAVVAELSTAARRDGPEGLDVEDKGLSLTLHFRQRPEVERATKAWAVEAAARAGVLLRPAKMSIELHPPIDVDKGTVVEQRSMGMVTVAYLGDDEGDLPAFAALDRLAAAGRTTVKVAVHTPDASPRLLDQADVHVDGPEGTVSLLRALL